MKKISYTFFPVIIAACLILPSLLEGQTIPAITRPVNDYAGILTPYQENQIADLLIAHRRKTGVQMAVLTVGTTGQMSIEEFSIKTAEKWGGGTKERDDGVLFTVAVYDRRMRIEVGYGLEGYLTDLKAGRILDGIREDFKSYQYAAGIEKAVREIMRATDEVRPGEEVPAAVRMWGAFAHVVDYYFIFFLLGALCAVLFILGLMKRKMQPWLSIPAGLFLFIALPVLFQFFFHGAWYWTPFVYLTGALAGGGMMAAITAPKTRKMKIVAAVITAIPALASLVSIFYLLQIRKPVTFGTSGNETILFGILIATNMIQFVIMGGVGGGSGGGGSYDSGGSYSSGGSSSSGGSNDTSWSGGGGSFGGGGASSSW